MRHRLLRSAAPALVLAAGLAFSAPALACMGSMATTDPGTQAAVSTDAGTATTALATDTAAASSDTAPSPTAAATASPTSEGRASSPMGPRRASAAWMQHFASTFSHVLASLTQAVHALLFVRPSL